MYKFKEEGMLVPCFVWANKGSIDDGAIQQIKNVSSLPFAFHHVSLMADAHAGFGTPIGSVVATNKIICPSIVGLDIGCGMLACQTNLKTEDVNSTILSKVLGLIKTCIPTGFIHHTEEQCEALMPPRDSLKDDKLIINREWNNALTQIGTLGGGNHFIEFQKDEELNIWIMLHSGSRNLGKKVADFYDSKAKELNEKYFSSVPSVWQLAFLPLDSRDGHQYLREMRYCVDFARANRLLMLNRIREAFIEIVPTFSIRSDILDVTHNSARFEHHFESDVIVHRKGAISARLDDGGIIPGSQGSKSFIVKGKGNKDSFESCSHGAGRIMSRSEAKKKLNLTEEIVKMNKLGIIHHMSKVDDLDEAASAYKSIDEVIENQKDLVGIVKELTPIAVVKG